MFVILTQQLGVGPPKGYAISNSENTWDEFVDNQLVFNLVKTYIYLKVRLIFDPPTNSSILENYKTQIAEYEWRLQGITEDSTNVL